MKEDRFGLSLLRERMDSIPSLIERYNFSLCSLPDLSGKILISGVGSSEAHARFLQYWLTELLQLNAQFVSFELLLRSLPNPSAGEGSLVIFSQGLSAQARRVLETRNRYSSCTLFTSCTSAGLEQAGKHEVAELLRKLQDEKTALVTYPLESEFQVLMRVVGPFFGFYAVSTLLRAMRAKIPAPPTSDLLAALQRARTAAAEMPRLPEAVGIVVSSPDSLYSQNLGFKLLEGCYFPPIFCGDFLHFPHGPFQCAVKRKAHLLLLSGGDEFERSLQARCGEMLESAGLTFTRFTSVLPPILRMLEYEMFLNEIVLREIKLRKINQREWPGKGLDGPLYNLP